MTAGAGILHIEKPPEALVASGGLFHGIQLWVNLPKAEKWAAPRYQDLRASEVGLLASADGGALVRVIAGDLAGHAGPGDTYTPMTLVHATVAPGRDGSTCRGTRASTRWPTCWPAKAPSVSKRGRCAPDSSPCSARATPCVAGGHGQESRSPELEVLVLGGRPIREPVAWYGPFVMNTKRGTRAGLRGLPGRQARAIPAVHNTPDEIVESSPTTD